MGKNPRPDDVNLTYCIFLPLDFILFVPFILIFLLSTQDVYAVDLTLAWDPSTEPDLDGYRVFCREKWEETYNYDGPAWEGDKTETTCTIYNLDNDTVFGIRVHEWDYLDGAHVEETAGYIVMERGIHTLPDGTMVEAQRFETDRTGSFGSVVFMKRFQEVLYAVLI